MEYAKNIEDLNAPRGIEYDVGGITKNCDWKDPIPLPKKAPVLPFHYEMLPEKLQPWIKDIAERMDCPPDFVAVSAMVAISSLIGCKAVIRPKRNDDWEIRPNLWGMLVGRPSTMKSPALQKAISPIRKLQELEDSSHEKNILEWQKIEEFFQIQHKSAKEQATNLIKQKKELEAKELINNLQLEDKPIRRRFWVNDATVEKLAVILSENPWGLLVYQDELYGMLSSMDKKGQEHARAFYLQSYDGNQSYAMDRISREDIFIKNVCLSLLGGIQPDRLHGYFKDALKGGSSDDGLMQRFGLSVYPDQSEKVNYVDRVPNLRAEQDAKDVFKKLSELKPNSENPFVCHFNNEAQEIFNEWCQKLLTEIKKGELSPPLESHFMKYTKLIPALALNIQLIEDSSFEGFVGEIALSRAIGWNEYLKSHAERIYQSGLANEVICANAILKRIKSNQIKDNFTVRDIKQKGWSGLSDDETVKSTLSLLVEHEFIRCSVSSNTHKGGRPTERYQINPQIFNHDY